MTLEAVVMTQDDVLGEVRSVFAAVAKIDPGAISPEKSLSEDLDVDSLTLIEVVVAIEDKFGLLIPDDEWQRFSTVGDLVNYLAGAGVVTA
jgi:acyl carrier protein